MSIIPLFEMSMVPLNEMSIVPLNEKSTVLLLEMFVSWMSSESLTKYDKHNKRCNFIDWQACLILRAPSIMWKVKPKCGYALDCLLGPHWLANWWNNDASLKCLIWFILSCHDAMYKEDYDWNNLRIWYDTNEYGPWVPSEFQLCMHMIFAYKW